MVAELCWYGGEYNEIKIGDDVADLLPIDWKREQIGTIEMSMRMPKRDPMTSQRNVPSEEHYAEFLPFVVNRIRASASGPALGSKLDVLQNVVLC